MKTDTDNINQRAVQYFNDQYADYLGDGYTQDEAEEFADEDLLRWQRISNLLPTEAEAWNNFLDTQGESDNY